MIRTRTLPYSLTSLSLQGKPVARYPATDTTPSTP